MSHTTLLIALVVLAAALEAAPGPTPIDVTVSEGTSMSVAVSPDGRTLAIDLQGSIWTLPSAGGAATRITDLFNDARQPTWSPDGNGSRSSRIATAGTTSGRSRPTAPSSTSSRGDRSTIASRSGRTTARASRSRPTAAIPLGSDYNIWVMDVATGAFTPADDGSGRRLHADLVARRQGDRVRLDARQRAVGVGRERRDGSRAQGDDRRPAASTRRRGVRAVRSSITTRRRARAASSGRHSR